MKRGTMAHEHIVTMMLADAAVQARDNAGVLQYAPLLEQLAVRDDHKPYLAVAHRAWGVAHIQDGQFTEAAERLRQALEIFEGLGARWQVGRTLVELAELDLAQSDTAAAQAHYASALAEFEALGAVPDMERTLAARDAVV